MIFSVEDFLMMLHTTNVFFYIWIHSLFGAIQVSLSDFDCYKIIHNRQKNDKKHERTRWTCWQFEKKTRVSIILYYRTLFERWTRGDHVLIILCSNARGRQMLLKIRNQPNAIEKPLKFNLKHDFCFFQRVLFQQALRGDETFLYRPPLIIVYIL